MECKVLKAFIDKDTLNGYSEGNAYESKDLKRIAFLQNEGYLELEDIPKEEPGEPKTKRTRKKKAGE
jgi:hypothetical protein